MAELKLYNGDIVLIDDDRFDELSAYRWHRTCRGYAARCPKPGKTIFMHRMVIGDPPDGLQVDHINGNKLDNRLENLRFCTAKENANNRYFDRPFRGTSRKNGGWQAAYAGKYLGMFETREAAAEAARAARLALRMRSL